jgi:hypothetical protein
MKIDLKETGSETVAWIQLGEWQDLANTVMIHRGPGKP